MACFSRIYEWLLNNVWCHACVHLEDRKQLKVTLWGTSSRLFCLLYQTRFFPLRNKRQFNEMLINWAGVCRLSLRWRHVCTRWNVQETKMSFNYSRGRFYFLLFVLTREIVWTFTILAACVLLLNHIATCKIFMKSEFTTPYMYLNFGIFANLSSIGSSAPNTIQIT